MVTIPLNATGQSDPRSLLVQALLQPRGSARGFGQGAASAGRSIVGALLAKQLNQEGQESRTRDQSLLARSILAGTGRPAETVPISGGEAVNFNPQPANRDLALRLLGQSSNPNLQATALAQVLQPRPESFEAVTDDQGNITGQRSTTTGKVVADPRAPDLLSPEELEQQLGLRRAGGNQINVGPQGQDFGDPPKGFVFARTQDGQIALQEDAERPGFFAPIVVPIAGGPAAREIAEEQEQTQTREETRAGEAQNVLRAIADVRQDVTGQGIFSPATGFTGNLLSSVGGTRAADVAANVATIRANVGFDKLQAMREASPTGGALGQVSENENKLLQSTIANLEQSQSEGQFMENLAVVENTFLKTVHGSDFSKMNLDQLLQFNTPLLTPAERAAINTRLDQLGVP